MASCSQLGALQGAPMGVARQARPLLPTLSYGPRPIFPVLSCSSLHSLCH